MYMFSLFIERKKKIETVLNRLLVLIMVCPLLFLKIKMLILGKSSLCHFLTWARGEYILRNASLVILYFLAVKV